MKLEYPATLLEFVLAGLLVLSPALLILPPDTSAPPTVIAMAILGAAYAVGIAANSFGNFLFRHILGPPVEERVIVHQYYLLELHRSAIGRLYNVDVDKVVNDARSVLRSEAHRRFWRLRFRRAERHIAAETQPPDAHNLVDLLEHYCLERSEDSRQELLYQARLKRMSRTAFIGVAMWACITIVVVARDLHLVVFDRTSLPDTTPQLALLVTAEIAVAAGLYGNARRRLKYRAQFVLRRFALLMSMDRQGLGTDPPGQAAAERADPVSSASGVPPTVPAS